MAVINQATKNAAAIKHIAVEQKKLVRGCVFDSLVGAALYIYPAAVGNTEFQRRFKVEGSHLKGEFMIDLEANCAGYHGDSLQADHLLDTSRFDDEDLEELDSSVIYIVGQVAVEMILKYTTQRSDIDGLDDVVETDETRPKGESLSKSTLSINFVDPVLECLSDVAINNLNTVGYAQAYKALSRGESSGSLSGEVVVDGSVKEVSGHWELISQ